MMRKTKIKQTALFLTLVYFLLSGSVTIQTGGHAAKHGHSAHHSAQHASFICTWMCSASSFVHSGDQKLDQNSGPPSDFLAIPIERILNRLSIFSFHIRPPPILSF
jgi:hypothetical protein